jgi:hypothetical protein
MGWGSGRGYGRRKRGVFGDAGFQALAGENVRGLTLKRGTCRASGVQGSFSLKTRF